MGNRELTRGGVTKVRDTRYTPTGGERKKEIREAANDVKNLLAYREDLERTNTVRRGIMRRV